MLRIAISSQTDPLTMHLTIKHRYLDLKLHHIIPHATNIMEEYIDQRADEQSPFRKQYFRWHFMEGLDHPLIFQGFSKLIALIPDQVATICISIFRNIPHPKERHN